MSAISNHLTTASTHLAPLEVLHAAPSVLLGVSPAAVAALQAIDVRTVFDLAASRVFANAAMLNDAAENPRAVFARYGLAPADVVDALPPGTTIQDLPRQSIEVLEGVGSVHAPALAAALNVTTVRDLALWPPYMAALDLLQRVLTPDAAPEADKDAPADLLPKSGEFPTERVFYSTLVFDGFDGDPRGLQFQPLENAGAVDLTPMAGQSFGFTRPGIGALLTLAQSWFAQGVALGQLLHSVALAPGESTRLAMIDWSRRTSGKQDESVSETEQLSNITEHSRALSEVTSAVASEAQSGFSSTHVSSHSEQEGGGIGLGLGPLTIGGSSGEADARSDAMSFSSSSGRRDLGASMTQNVVDRTQQQANAARNRRATVVKEVSESEHESISTRVVTNYNHMHALSVQYYEVVQIYRVTVQLQRVERCLFIPMRIVDFKNANLVRMFRKALLAAAIDEEARSLLATDFDTVQITSLGTGKLTLNNASGMPAQVSPDLKKLSLPDEARLMEIEVYRSRGGINDLLPLSAVDVLQRDGIKAELDIKSSTSPPSDTIKLMRVPLRELASISLTSPPGPQGHDYSFRFTLSYNGGKAWFDTGFDIPPGVPLTVLTFTGGGIWQRLIDHLEANRLHYSQAIFRNLDPASVTLLLSGYSYRGRPVSSMIDPKPITTAGNYLVFRTHVTPRANGGDEEQQAWARWLDEHGVTFDQVKEDLVPLPSGGVFAEAVLGRYNSAEKLDITRFWNWQDSPIPIVAPDIAPVQAGSRSQGDVDLRPGGFSQPLVNIVSPTSLPDPAGLAPAFQALASGNMFRDMSGLAATIGLAQAGLQATSDAATAANVQAGSNLATAAKKEVEMFKAALAFVGAILGAGKTDTSPSTISNDGAKINHGRSLDQRGIAPNGSAGAPAIGAGSGGASGGGSSGGAAGAIGAAGGPVVAGLGSNEADAFQHSVRGTSGQLGGSLVQALLGSPGGAGGAGGSAAALNAGNFASFVTADRLDLEVADVLRALDTYPADSWAKQMATFAWHELNQGNLLGIFSTANRAKAKAQAPAESAVIDTMAVNTKATTHAAIGGTGNWKGIILIDDAFLKAGMAPGIDREKLAQVLAHELTHFRIRDFFIELELSAPADNPSFYIGTAQASTPALAKLIMGEIVADHVAWRVHQDLRNRSQGTPIAANPNKKGFYRFALEGLKGNGWPDQDDYLKALKTAGTYNKQIAVWLQKIGANPKTLYHDDEAVKNKAVRKFFDDVFTEVSPAFATPTEARDGAV